MFCFEIKSQEGVKKLKSLGFDRFQWDNDTEVEAPQVDEENEASETEEKDLTVPPIGEEIPGWNCDGEICPPVCDNPDKIAGPAFVRITDGEFPSCCWTCFRW